MAEFSEFDSLVEDWIVALQSGFYKPNVTNGDLRCGNTFSFIGVLCDIYDNTRWTDGYLWKEDYNRSGGVVYRFACPPEILCALLDIPKMSSDFLNVSDWDHTLRKSESWSFYSLLEYQGSGIKNYENAVKFIQNEVIPYIEKNKRK